MKNYPTSKPLRDNLIVPKLLFLGLVVLSVNYLVIKAFTGLMQLMP